MSSWIKMRTNLATDPRVGALADECDVSEATVIGALFMLWSMADEHSQDGQLEGIRPKTIDRRTGVPGFSAALEKVGWLVIRDGHAEIPDFEKHNSKSAKRRALEARRQAHLRNDSAPNDPDSSDKKPRSQQRQKGRTHSVRMPCVRAAYLEKEREKEKEKNRRPLTPSSDTEACEITARDEADEAAAEAVVFSFRDQAEPNAGLVGEALAVARELAAMIGDPDLDRSAPFVRRDGPEFVRQLMAHTKAQRPRDPGAYVIHMLRTRAKPTLGRSATGTGKTAAEIAAEKA